jgi:hypothetical protein
LNKLPTSPAARRGLAAALFAAVLLACAAGAWATQSSMVTPFVMPGASEVAVSSRRLDGLRVTYRYAGEPYGWRGEIMRRLAVRGWRSRDYTFGVTERFTVTWYTRTIDLGPATILESAVVGGDPHDPHLVIVEIHRELHWRRR